ncbi:hypothetical protein V6N13_110628 [Hibiscus sabdariffa]
MQPDRASFRQEDDKAMHGAWERYRDLFKRCPMHGLPEWTQVSIFYNFINTPTRMMFDASANGTLLDKPPREGLEILEKLAQNDYQHPTTRKGNMRRGTAQVDSSDTILAQISTITNFQEYAEASKRPGVAKGATHEQCKVISTRSGKVLKPPTENKQREATVANSQVASDKDIPTPTETPASIEEDQISQLNLRKQRSQPQHLNPNKLGKTHQMNKGRSHHSLKG